MEDYQKLYRSNQDSFIAYRKIVPNQANKTGIIFLGGFNSNMNGTKALATASFAKENNLDFISFDYSGHGNSSGEFLEGSIDSWLEDTLLVIDKLADKPQILVGSSMGGWIMLLAAMARPDKIKGLVGIAAAPDFTEDLIWNCLSAEQKDILATKKVVSFGNGYCDEEYLISRNLIEGSRKHLLLDKEIPLDLPIHLIHGMNDKDVPYETAIRIAKITNNENIKITLIKGAGHRLSNPDELEIIFRAIEDQLRFE